jgi:hypothetical protein
MTRPTLPRGIEVYEIGARRLYIKTGTQNFSISEDDVTPEELVAIAQDMSRRRGGEAGNAPPIDFVAEIGDEEKKSAAVSGAA